MLGILMANEQDGVVTEAVDRSPIAYLDACRVAQLVGVPLADDDETRRAYDAERESCARRIAIEISAGRADNNRTLQRS